MNPTLVETLQVVKRFAGVTALDGVTLSIRRGEIHCLAGENGSGKSTWIKTIAGVLRPDAGHVAIDGRPRPHLRPIEAIREGIQVIWQDLALFPGLSVAENISFPTLIREGRRLFRRREAERIAASALDEIGVGIDPASTAGELPISGKQLVAIARALLHDVRLLVMDEPTSALTRREVERLFTVVRGLAFRGVAVLFVSHRPGEILEISERITVLRNGRKVLEERTEGLDPKALAAHLSGRPIRGLAAATATAPVAPFPEGRTAAEARPLLRVEALSRRGRFEDVAFELHAGEVLGVAGLLGSGRTALALALFGLEPADRGRIIVDGSEVAVRDPRDAVRAGIAYVPEDRLAEGLFLGQSVERNIAAGILDRLAGAAGWIGRGTVAREAASWIDALRIRAASTTVPASALSGGNQQKVVLARALAARARILVLNRPTAGVDVGAREELHERVRSLAREGRGVVIISDEASELASLSGRVLVLHRGRPVRELRAPSEDDVVRALEELE